VRVIPPPLTGQATALSAALPASRFPGPRRRRRRPESPDTRPGSACTFPGSA